MSQKHTPGPWQHVCGHDTHKVKRDASGRMLGPVTMDLDDYDRAMDCVNACEGINPEAIPEIVGALKAAIEWHDLIRQDYPDMAGLVRALSDGRAAIARVKSV
jgi:hypothetical protein